MISGIMLNLKMKMVNRNYVSKVQYLRKKGCKIGKNCRIISTVSSFGSEPYLIAVGDDCLFSSNIQIFTHDGSVSVLNNLGYFGQGIRCDKMDKVVIGNNCFIGANAIILPGVTIGNNVMIGAGSIVTKNIPDNSVACGVPAKVVSTIDEYYNRNKDRFFPTGGMPFEKKRQYYQTLSR